MWRAREDKHQRGGDRRDDRRRDQIEMMDIGRLDAQEECGGDARAAEGQPQQAAIARAPSKKRRPGQGGERGHETDPIAKLAQQ